MARPDYRNGVSRVTDEERSRAVAELRKASTGAYSHVDALDVIANSIGVDIVGKFDYEVENETYAALADLIDRPTCYVVEHKTHCGSYGCEEAGTLWVLSCGDECVNDSDFPPRYCPDCGARVVSADD